MRVLGLNVQIPKYLLVHLSAAQYIKDNEESH